MRVVWTEAALSQLAAIRDYIDRTSPEYARRTVERLVNRSEQVGTFPRSGRTVPEYQLDDVREIVEGSYRVIYLFRADQVEVLAVIHTSRRGLSQED